MNDGGLAWWMWVIGGLALAALEVLTPGGFYLLFFGIGAVAVGLIVWTGLLQTLLWQLVAFSALSLITTVLFRQRLRGLLGPGLEAGAVDSLVGEAAVALDDIDPAGFGKVELRGAAWTARNAGSGRIARGQRCTVERVDGLSLWVTV